MKQPYRTLLLALFLTGCHGPAIAVPTAPEGMGFRLASSPSSGVISGRVLAPAGLLGAGPTPIASGSVELLDSAGASESRVPKTQLDARGDFVLKGAPLEQAGFVRAVFSMPDGSAQALEAYVFPTSIWTCLDLTLASTLLSDELAQSPGLAESANPQREGTLVTRVGATWRQAAQALGVDLKDPTALRDFLQQLTAASPTRTPDTPTAANGLLSWLFSNVPGLQSALDNLADAELTVGFSLQGFGANRGRYPHGLDARYRMSGHARIFWQVPRGLYDAVTFSLDDGPRVDAGYQDGAWRATLDSRQVPDGPHVLLALGRNAARAAPKSLKTYVYVLNAPTTIANSGAECPSPTATGAQP